MTLPETNRPQSTEGLSIENAFRQAILDERERCAVICAAWAAQPENSMGQFSLINKGIADAIAAEIRKDHP